MRLLSLLNLMWTLLYSLSTRAANPSAFVRATRLFSSSGDVFDSFAASYRGKDILVLGDGDFSYSKALCALTDGSSRITSTTRASREELARAFPTAEQNTRQLQDSGVSVEHNVDATSLPSSLYGAFDTVIFNFPHIDGKQNIKYNRELLLGFLRSSRGALRDGGEMQVALTSPQSGLSARNMADWDRSWKLAQQAAEAGLYVVGDQPFPLELFAPLGYLPSGRRGIDKSFGTYSPRLISLRPRTIYGQSAVAAPVFVHEVHLLMNKTEPDTRGLLRRVEQCLQEICSDHCGRFAPEQKCLLVDTYHCPRTHNTSYVFQIAYANLDGSLAFSRGAANLLKGAVERALPAALGLEPRAEKHRGLVSAAYPFYLWAALHEGGESGAATRLSMNPGLGAASR